MSAAPVLPASLAIRPHRTAGRGARRRSHCPGVCERAIYHRLPRPAAHSCHGPPGRLLDRCARREWSADGDVARAPGGWVRSWTWRSETALRLQEAVVVSSIRPGRSHRTVWHAESWVSPANIYPTRRQMDRPFRAGDQPFVRLCEAIEAPEAPHDPVCHHGGALAASAGDRRCGQGLGGQARSRRRRGAFSPLVAGTAIQSVDDILADEHVQARQAVLTLRSQTGHDFLAPAPVPKFSRTPARQPLGAPRLGEHTQAPCGPASRR